MSDSDETELDPLTDIPAEATEPALVFWKQHIADLQLLTLESMVIDELKRFTETVAKVLRPEKPPEETFPGHFRTLRSIQHANSFNVSTRKEIALTRYVDNYLVYVAEMVALIFRSRPETLRSQEQVAVEDVLRHATLNDFTEWLADERVTKLTFRGFREIADFVQKRFGLALAQDSGTSTRLIKAIAIRNLLVHRRGIVDARFMKVMQDEGLEIAYLIVGERIPEFDHAEAMDVVCQSVAAFDAAASAKYQLHRHQTSPEEWWALAQFGRTDPSWGQIGD